jgi:hypothetical protein
MGVSLQVVTLQVRGGSNHEKYGDPYSYCCTVQVIGQTAHVSALCGNFTRKDFADFKELLSQYGVKDIDYERLKREAKTVQIKLKE